MGRDLPVGRLGGRWAFFGLGRRVRASLGHLDPALIVVLRAEIVVVAWDAANVAVAHLLAILALDADGGAVDPLSRLPPLSASFTNKAREQGSRTMRSHASSAISGRVNSTNAKTLAPSNRKTLVTEFML